MTSIAGYFLQGYQQIAPQDLKIQEQQEITAAIPGKQLAEGSLKIAGKEEKVLTDWTREEHQASFDLMKKITSFWNRTNTAPQFLVLGKETEGQFSWEVVPQKDCDSPLSKFWQQFQVLWRVAFGGKAYSEQTREAYQAYYQGPLSTPFQDRWPQEIKVNANNDAFCNENIIEKQKVLEGNTIRVLYDYRPMGIGEEKLHFLFVPKEHRATFRDLTEEEYLEAMDLCKGVMSSLSKTRNIYTQYLLHKTGWDAGQTVGHWHLHLITSMSSTEDWAGKAKVFGKMLSITNSALRGEALRLPVEKYREEFKKEN